jgi:hypothetical protein
MLDVFPGLSIIYATVTVKSHEVAVIVQTCVGLQPRTL